MATLPLDHELQKTLRAEYKVASEYSNYLTNIDWQVGSILVGGSLAAVALSLTTKTKIATLLITVAAIIAIVAWFLFYKRNHGFGDIAAQRLRYIEWQLGLGSLGGGLNNWLEAERVQGRVGGPAGYHIVLFLTTGLVSVFAILSCVPPLYYCFLATLTVNKVMKLRRSIEYNTEIS